MQWAWAILSSMACPALQYFFHIISQTVRFSKRLFDYKMCVLISSTNFVGKNFSFQEEPREIWSKMSSGLHVKYPLFLVYFHETWISRVFFQKIPKYQISWKSVQWEPSCSMRTDGRRGRHGEANSRFPTNLRTRLKMRLLVGSKPRLSC